MTHQDYLKEMGITTWVSRDDGLVKDSVPESIDCGPEQTGENLSYRWTFIVGSLSGDALILFEKILAALMLNLTVVQVLSPQQAKRGLATGQVAVAMGESMGNDLLDDAESFEALRGAIHSLVGQQDEIPLVLTYDVARLLKNPADKGKVWQDLLLAKSLLA